MADSYITKIKLGDVTYKIKDDALTTEVSTLSNTVDEKQDQSYTNGANWATPVTSVEGALDQLNTRAGGSASDFANEQKAREDGDTALDGKITAEATARETADTTLSGRVDKIEASDLTIQVNSTTIGTYDVNKNEAQTINIVVPTTAADVSAIPASDKGKANGVATLDADGKVPSSQLPSYVDDVKEAANLAALPTTGEADKIYVTLDDNKTYRWSGTQYVEISASVALGETSGTAYYGDKGKTAYDHSQLTSGNPHGVTATDLGLGNVENKSSATIRGEITSANVTSALGFTPYSNTNPNGYTDNIGTITGITVNGGTKKASGDASFNVPTFSYSDNTLIISNQFNGVN